MKKITQATIAVVVIASTIGGMIHQQIKINELESNISSLETKNAELSMKVDSQTEEIYNKDVTIHSFDKNLGYLTRSYGFTRNYGYNTLDASEFPYKVEGCDLLKSISFEKPFEMVGSTDGDMYMVVETGDYNYTVCEVIDGMVEFDFDTQSQAYRRDQIIWCTIFSKEEPELHYRRVNDGHFRWINWVQYGEFWISEDAIPWTDITANNSVSFVEGI